MSLNDWVIFHSLTWAELAARVGCHPARLRHIAYGEPTNKELAARIREETGISVTIGRGRNWRKGKNETMRLLQYLVRRHTSPGRVMVLMGYKNIKSARAMIGKAKRSMHDAAQMAQKK